MMASKCRKFVPNIFNKTKCQTCFGAKEAHSAEALENNKATRKVSKCGYLFVAPDFDFSSPLDRSRRWQRRFFVLYDDAELTFSVDDNVDTVPQEIIDMNKCLDVINTEKQTSHLFSLGVVTSEKTHYIKGESKEESQWWYDVLIQYPRSLKSIKPRRKPPLSNKENVQPSSANRFEIEKVKGRTELPTFATYRGVRSLKHKYDKNYQDGLRKSSSLHDLSTEDKELTADLVSTKYLSCSGDHLNYFRRNEVDYPLANRQQILADHKHSNPYFPNSRTLWHHSGRNSTSSVLTSAPYTSTPTPSLASVTPSVSRGSNDENKRSVPALDRSRVHRERSRSLKDFPTTLSLPRDVPDDSMRSVVSVTDISQIEPSRDDDTESNETDELKMARSSELYSVGRSNPNIQTLPDQSNTLYEDLVYMKKGWLVKLGKSEKDLKKHWFVLAGNSLHYYKDAKAEDSNNLDGRIDLSTCYEVSEISLPRNYGLKIKTHNGKYQLAAMTSGIRNNWMKALRLCMDLHNSTSKKYASSLAGKALGGLTTTRAIDDFDVSAATGNTQVVTNTSGETAFQLVGSRSETNKRDFGKNARRHHSDVNPGNVSKVLSVSEFSGALDMANLNISSSTVSNESQTGTGSSHTSSASETGEEERSRSKTPHHRGSTSSQDSLSWSQSSGPIRRFVEGSDGIPSTSSSSDHPRRSKQNISSDVKNEEERREKLRRGKSPSARIKEKSRSSKAPRLHSPPPVEEYSYSLPTNPRSSLGSDDDITPELYHDASDHIDGDRENTKDGMLVELLETEVESLKESLDHKEEELVKMQQANHDLKTRLQTTDSQMNGDSWNSNKQLETSQIQGLKKQMKDSKDAIQRQKNEIDNLKSRLDMSVSKLTGTEKALSEALKELKQEKERFLKLTSEWNRRMRTLESQLKDSSTKLERNKENLVSKERECRRLETEMKGALQKSREYEREILKLKAVEHEYRVLKEKFDDKEQDIASLRGQLCDREAQCKKLESELEELEKSNSNEQDALENHIEQLQTKLCTAHQRQATMTDSMTNNMAGIVDEKNNIISQLEEKLVEKDRKIADMNEELQAEMSENTDILNNFDVLQEEKKEFVKKIERLQIVQTKLSKLDSENSSLKKIIDQLKTDGEKSGGAEDSRDKEKFHKTIQELNQQVQKLQLQLIEKFEDIDRTTESSSQLDSQELLHTVLLVDSELKDVNSMLLTLRQKFDGYLAMQQGDNLSKLISLADMIEDIGRKCQSVQDVLSEVPPSPPLSPAVIQAMEYYHEITVDTKSNPKDILVEYKGLKNKFDCAVSELKKLRKEVNNVYCSYDKLQHEDKLMKTQLMRMEETYKTQLESMMKRVETLTLKLGQVKNPGQITSIDSRNIKSAKHLDLFALSQEVEKLLDELDKKFAEVEVSTSTKATPIQSKSRMSISPDEIIVQLKNMKIQLDHTNLKLKDISQDLTPQKGSKPDRSSGEHLQTRLSQYGQRIDNITNNLEKVAVESEENVSPSDTVDNDQELAFEDCLSEIRGRIIIIGEQLDALDDDSSESESEDEDETTIDDVREKLSHLLEFVEEHSKLSSFDWKVLDKMTKQHSTIMKSKSCKQEPVSQEDRLKLFADRVSLEAVILGEMASLLQNKYSENLSNPLINEIHSLNNMILVLHQHLDVETRHFNMENSSEDILSSYADYLAERIIFESESLSCDNRDLMQSSNSQITVLAMESLTRSQIDSQINETISKPLAELESVSSHIVSRALIQGELTCALQKVKNRVNSSVEKCGIKLTQKEYAFQELKARETTVLDFCKQYENKMVATLALIVARQGDEMAVDQGPVSVLEAVCSEISTIIEKHIQSCKQRVRTANVTHTAHKYDQIVSRLRLDRESVLNSIKEKHNYFISVLADGKELEDQDVLLQSLDSTINNFGEILSQKSIILAISSYIGEMYKANDLSVYQSENSDIDSVSSSNDIERGFKFFLRNLSELLEKESVNKQNIVFEIQKSTKLSESESRDTFVISLPDLQHYPKHLSPYAENLVREAVFQSQLTYVMLKMRLEHENELSQHTKIGKLNRDESQDLEIDFHSILAPLEDVLDSKFEDESEVLHMFGQQIDSLRQAFNSTESSELEEEMQQLEHMLDQEITAAHERHEIQMEVFKQEVTKIEKIWDSREYVRDECRDRMEDLEVELNSIKCEHEEEVERMKQDVLTAVGAIRANEELSEINLTEKVQNLIHQLASQKRTYKLFLEGLKRKINSLDKTELVKKLDEQLMAIKRSASQDEDVYSMASSTSESDLSHTEAVDGGEEVAVLEVRPPKLKTEKGRKSELDKLRKEKEEALAEEMRDTKAALDALRKAYEVELTDEKEKYKEALMTMYTDDYLAEIRRQHSEEIHRSQEELKQMELHYSSKTEDCKIIEVKMKQMKQDYDGHIKQLLTSNEQLNRLVNEEVDEIKEFIKRKPSRLAPGSATVEEELYDAQIMVRVKDVELQKLRLQVKNHENSGHRMMEEQRQTMTENLRLIKEHQELKTEYKKVESLTGRTGKPMSDDTGSRRPVRRAPSFHQRARSPSPAVGSTKEGEHASRDGHRRRHLGPKDMKRSKSSPSLPYVFDTKTLQDVKQGRDIKTPRSVKAASASKR